MKPVRPVRHQAKEKMKKRPAISLKREVKNEKEGLQWLDEIKVRCISHALSQQLYNVQRKFSSCHDTEIRIQKISYDGAEIRNFSYNVEKYFTSERSDMNTNEKKNCLTFAAKGVFYYVTIVTVLFSRVKVTCYFSREKISHFRAEAHLVLHWCLFNKILYPIKLTKLPGEIILSK